MGIQRQLDKEALDMLPMLKGEINKHRAMILREAMNSRIALCDMNESQLNEFQRDILGVIRFNEGVGR